MNFNEMQSLWNTPGNQVSPAEQRRWAETFRRRIIRRRRFQAAWLANTFFWLAVITGLAAWNLKHQKVALDQEWALIPLLIVPWAFAFHFLRRFLNPPEPVARGEISVAHAFRAALCSIQQQKSHLRKVAVLFGVMLPILVGSLVQLHAVGKVSANELKSMAILFGGIFLLGGAGIAARYFGRVLPQQRQLNALLSELNEPPAN